MLSESAGLFRQNQVIVNVNSRMNKRVTLFGFYTLGFAKGTPSTPMNQYDINSDFGPTNFDTRHRAFIGGSVTAPWRVMLSPFITASSGAPYNITTGTDYLGSTIFNARPSIATAGEAGAIQTAYGLLNPNPKPGEALLPYNFGRGPSQFNVNLRLARTWGFGNTKESAANAAMQGGPMGGPGMGGPPMGGGGYRGGGGGGMRGGGGMGGPGGMFGGGSVPGKRYNLTLSLSARNLLNHVNLSSPVGNLRSPSFGESLSLASGFGPMGGGAVANRRLDMQLRFAF